MLMWDLPWYRIPGLSKRISRFGGPGFSSQKKSVVVEIPQADMMGGVPADVLSAVLARRGRPYRKPRRKNFRQEQLLCWLLAEIRVRNEEMYARSSCVAIKLKRGEVTGHKRLSKFEK